MVKQSNFTASNQVKYTFRKVGDSLKCISDAFMDVNREFTPSYKHLVTLKYNKTRLDFTNK